MIYFLIYLFFEVIVSVNIASAIGSLATFFEIIGSALLGFIILNERGKFFLIYLKKVIYEDPYIHNVVL